MRLTPHALRKPPTHLSNDASHEGTEKMAELDVSTDREISSSSIKAVWVVLVKADNIPMGTQTMSPV
jgi:hypothetical protein